MSRTAAITLGWLLATVVTLPAQDTPVNPHGSFRGDCRQCHDAQGWSPADIGPDFDHSKFKFPLEHAHANVPCLLCHLTLEFETVTGTTCAACHEDVHFGELGGDCDRCHTTRNFIDRSDEVRSHRATRFPLTGVHRTLECGACHEARGASLQFVNTPTECVTCHRSAYESTASPDHVSASFPTDCAQCHSTFSWAGSSFNHSLTRFPLTGAHRGADCRGCHPGFEFAGAPTQCIGCHRDEYDATTRPAHLAAGFPTDCASCHSTQAWEPATFDHSLTAFPLTGAHIGVECRACHVDDVFAGTDPACASCHLADYQATTNPDHVGSGFGPDCASCHDTSRWEGATFDHDGPFFPIYSGRHRNEWTSCSDCHTNPTDLSVFSCLGCHPHRDRPDTDDKHREQSGYLYDSEACLSCHPRGTH